MPPYAGKSHYRLAIHYLIALCLCALSYALFVSIDSHDAEGEQRLLNPGFSDGLREWQTHGKNHAVRSSAGMAEIKHHSFNQFSSLFQCWERAELPDVVVVGIEARTSGLVPGSKSWHEARVGIVGYAPEGKRLYQLTNRLVRLREDRPWQSYRAALPLPQEAEKFCFRIALYGSQGVFQVKNPTLYQGRLKPGYRFGSTLLLMLWVGFGVWWLKLLTTHYWHRPQRNYLLATLLALLVGILMPSDLKLALEQVLISLLPGLQETEQLGYSPRFPSSLLPNQWDLSKFAHLLGFFLLSGILFSEGRKPAWLLLPGLLLSAIASETLQSFVPGRTPRVSDIVVDGLGILAGWWMVRLFYFSRGLLIRK